MIRARHKNKLLDHNRAKQLRQQPSGFEQRLWKELQQLYKTTGIKFRRQHPLSPYIVDFACMEAKLIVELDGYSHDLRQDHDRKRDAYITQLGYMILRFSNEEFTANKEGIVTAIALRAEKLIKTNPSPAKTRALRCNAKFLRPLPQGERNRRKD